MIPIFIETDIHDDVDDVGALAVAHSLAHAGKIEILGVNVNTTSVWGPRVVKAINDYYGREVPVGARYPSSETTGPQEFARGTSRLFGTDRFTTGHEAVRLFRQALSAAPAEGVTVVSLGFFENLVGLLESDPDDVSPLPGDELVRRSVCRTVVMGGRYSAAVPDACEQAEYNFAEDPESTRIFLRDWPGPIDFVGWETGREIITGRGLLDAHGRTSPVATAYQLHSGHRIGRPSWDLIAVLLAAMPEWNAFRWSAPGVVTFDGDAGTGWTGHPEGRHRYAIRCASSTRIAEDIDLWLERPAPAVRERLTVATFG